MPRRVVAAAVVATVAVAGAVLVTAIGHPWRLEAGEWALWGIVSVGCALVAAVAVAVVATAVRWRRGRPVTVVPRVPGARRAVALVVLALGVVATTPVEAEWDVECNRASGIVPLASLPWPAARDRLVYSGAQTLIGCIDPSRPTHQ
ncbi:MAG: hypothetical protein AB7G37_00395 [Solirubrobacteraceae bacterium]